MYPAAKQCCCEEWWWSCWSHSKPWSTQTLDGGRTRMRAEFEASFAGMYLRDMALQADHWQVNLCSACQRWSDGRNGQPVYGREQRSIATSLIQLWHLLKFKIATLVTDRHKQIAKWARENIPATDHRYDIWHLAKCKLLIFSDLLWEQCVKHYSIEEKGWLSCKGKRMWASWRVKKTLTF